MRAVAECVNIGSVEGYSDTVTLPTTLNGQTSLLLADRVIAPRERHRVETARSGEAESEAKDTAETFRVENIADTGQRVDYVQVAIIALGVILALAVLSGILGMRRLGGAVRRARQE